MKQFDLSKHFQVFENKKHTMQSPFIRKLKKILQDPTFEEIIGWTRQQTSIQIKDEKQFEELVLPKFFRHGHLASFIRQLNLYGFRKVRSSSSHIFTHQSLESGKILQDIIPKRKMQKEREQDKENAMDDLEGSERKQSSGKVKEKKELEKNQLHFQKKEKLPIKVQKIEYPPQMIGPQSEWEKNSWIYMLPPQPQPFQFGLPPFPFCHFQPSPF